MTREREKQKENAQGLTVPYEPTLAERAAVKAYFARKKRNAAVTMSEGFEEGTRSKHFVRASGAEYRRTPANARARHHRTGLPKWSSYPTCQRGVLQKTERQRREYSTSCSPW